MVLKYLSLNRTGYFCFLKITGTLLLETELEREVCALDWEKERAVKVAFCFIALAQSHKPGHFSQPPRLLRLWIGRLRAQHSVNIYSKYEVNK